MKNKILSNKWHFIVTGLVIVFVVSLSIGFSAFNTEMSISGIVGKVRPNTDVRITGLELVESSGNAVVRNSEYSEDKLFFDVSFPDDTSYVVYEVELTVFGSQSVALEFLSTVSGQAPMWENSNLNFYDPLCNSYGQCTLGLKKTFNLKLYDSPYDSISDYNFTLQTDFINSYTITYVGDSGDYPKYVLHGYGLYVNCSQNFNVVDVYMGGTLLDSSHYSYYEGMFNMMEVTGDVTIVFYEVIYGDVDGDGIVDDYDGVLLDRYVNGMYELTDEGKKAADINGDGVVNALDANLLSLILNGWYDMPGKSPLTDYVRYGDVNADDIINVSDANLVNAYLAGNKELTEQQLEYADINNDGVVDNVDLILINGVAKKQLTHSILEPMTNYTLYGDVEIDGNINAADLAELKLILAGSVVPTEQQKKNADINADGVIDSVDQTALNQYLAGSFDGLPYVPYS